MDSDCLFIGFDKSDDFDVSALSVIRMDGSQATVLNIFTGQEAEEVYTKLTGIKMEEGPGVLLIVWNNNPNDKVIGRDVKVTDTADGVIVTAQKDEGFEEFCEHMNKAMDKEIYNEYVSGMRASNTICESWNITKEELTRIINSQK